MSRVPDGVSLVGRDVELRQIAELIDGARAGSGRAMRLAGEAGIGKTALIEHVARRMADDVMLLRVTGFEEEVDVPWSGLADLVEPLLAAGLDRDLAPPRRLALRRVLALVEPAEAAIDPLAVVGALRDIVLLAAGHRPVLMLIDDMQWLDEPSARALRHARRSWVDRPVAVLETSRVDAVDHGDDDVQWLGPIDRAHAVALVEAEGVSSKRVRERLVDELGGRPLLLRAAARSLDENERRGAGDAEGPVRVPTSALAVAQRRLEGLSVATRQALLFAATATGGDVDVVGRALTHIGASLDDLADAERAGLVEITGTTVVFDHPSLRSAVYHGADGPDRRQAHRLVGDETPDPATGVQHHALSVTGPDAALAERVIEAGELLRDRGAPVEAARAFQLAARVAPDRQSGAVCLRRAAELLVDTLEAAAVRPLLDRADLVETTPVEAVRRAAIRLRIDARSDDTVDPADEFRSLADRVRDNDPAFAAELLIEALAPLVRSMRAAEFLDTARDAHDLARRAGDELLCLQAEVALGGGLVASGDQDGGPMLDQFRALLEIGGSVQFGAFLAEVAAPVLGFLHRSEEAASLLDTLESELRDREAIPVLVSVLGARAMLAHGPDLALTVQASQEAIALADDIGQPDLARLAGSSLVVAAGVMGDTELCRSVAAKLQTRDDRFSRRGALIGLGVLALGHGDLDGALEAYERLRDEHGIGAGLIRWEPEWAETLVRLQRRDEAEAVLAELEEVGYAGWAIAGVARVRGMLAADEDKAAEEFELSVAVLQLANNPVGEGRTHLVWGERVRRARRRASARDHLQQAHELLAGAGATVWADRAEAELARASATVRGRDSAPGDLTDHERRVACLAAGGASNKEIGTDLYISPRTVETHLSAVYRKLGVRNRRQLAARALEDEQLRPN